MDIANLIQTVAIYALPVLFAITIHEAAHGYVARYFGDNTAWSMGRVTLNPIKHIDPLGTIAMPLLLYFATSGAFFFGYAKPVPVDFGNLRRPKQDMIWVALAGPGANFIQIFLWAILYAILLNTGIDEPFFLVMCMAGVYVNLLMFAFNLFPLPPLDGGRILVGLLPMRQALWVSRIEPWGFFVVLGLIFLGVVGAYWLWPLLVAGYGMLDLLNLSIPIPPKLT